MINILIVDDSATETVLLKNIFESAGDMKVVGCGKNGKEALELAARLKPDIITMDVHMPLMDGLEATRYIMSTHPIPIVVISSKLNSKELDTTFEALEAGALCVLEKPTEIHSKAFENEKKYMISIIRAMSEVRVIKKKFTPAKKNQVSLKLPDVSTKNYEIVAIGTSIGGPQVLAKIFSELPANFPVPIVVVQHMSHGFIQGFAHWLDKTSLLKIKNAEQGEELKPGKIYFAQDHLHLEIVREQNTLRAKLVAGPPVSGFCPSATVLLKSVAKVCGKNGIGILLTGMGSDGAQGLLEIKKVQGHTIIQDQKSALVFGMPGVAQSLGAVDKVVELDNLAEYLVQITKKG